MANESEQDGFDDVGGVVGETMENDGLDGLDLEFESDEDDEQEQERESVSEGVASPSKRAETDDENEEAGVKSRREQPLNKTLGGKVTEEDKEFAEHYIMFSEKYDSVGDLFREFIGQLKAEKGEEVERRRKEFEQLKGGL